ncbi:MAG: hypothetical protein JWN89_732 [Parcubacteria group bacterium]|nr:hypothetical protein [Parcubacteria group bacterium]
MKKIIILDHNGGRLANQLWNFISLYAFSLEKGYCLENYSFWRYAEDFSIPLPRNPLVRSLLFGKLIRYKWFRMLGIPDRFVRTMKFLYQERIVSDNSSPLYLPPSAEADPFSSKEYSTIYTNGWLFRNPIGLQKHRQEIISYFTPKKGILRRISEKIARLKESSDHIVGVHIRQGDYKVWEGGRYYFEQPDVRIMLDEYLAFSGRLTERTIFLICSDGPVDLPVFDGLRIEVAKGTPVEDLYALAHADSIMGSNSTFGAYASYYGDKPFIVFNKRIDWDYYKGKGGYFENKYSTLVHY